MATITPCRTQVSDRFPVASFVVRVPSDRCFEVACTTNPELLKPGAQRKRTQRNFFTTRLGGLLRAPGGEATILIPPDQLKRFAGSQRVYYALGSYENAEGRSAEFSVSPLEPTEAPFIRLAADFTGRALDSAAAPTRAVYGRRKTAALVWGGDIQRRDRAKSNGPSAEYDDGYDPSLWSRGSAPSLADSAPSYASRTGSDEYSNSRSTDYTNDYGSYATSDQYTPHTLPPTRNYAGSGVEPQGFEDPGALASSVPPSPPVMAEAMYGGPGEPEGYEDAAALRGATASVAATPTGDVHYGGQEPEGFEDAGQLIAATGTSAMPPTPRPPRVAKPSVALGGRAEPWADSYGNATGVDHAREPEGYEDGADLRARGGSAPSTTPQAPANYGTGRAAPRTPLTIKEKGRIVRPVFRLRGGLAAYGQVRRDGQRGLMWGIGNFAESDGTLPEVLAKAWPRDQRRHPNERVFPRAFGARFEELSQRFGNMGSPDARAFAEALAHHDDWDETLSRSGSMHEGEAPIPPERDPIKLAQNEVTITRHLDPMLSAAQRLDVSSDRGLAMMYDMVVSEGLATTEAWFERAVSGAPREPIARTEHIVRYAEERGEPFAGRMRELVGCPELSDTIYELAA